MPLANCPICNRLFNRTLNEPCPACREAEEEAYASLSEFLGRNPEADLEQVAAGTGVDADLIRRLVRTGRLIGFDALAMSVIACQRCGVPLGTGRFCSPCQRELRTGLVNPR